MYLYYGKCFVCCDVILHPACTRYFKLNFLIKQCLTFETLHSCHCAVYNDGDTFYITPQTLQKCPLFIKYREPSSSALHQMSPFM